MNVLVNGIGNIGTTLACLLQDFKSELGITKVVAFKNTPHNWLKEDLEFLGHRGITVITSKDRSLKGVLGEVDYVFDTMANGMGLTNKKLYAHQSNLIGCCAQGSEKGFGKPFASGITDDYIKNEKLVQIVSCNTHGAASILKTFCGQDLSNLKQADFVVVRRSEDIGNHQRLVGANVVARHLHPETGTHHAIDVKDMYQAIGIDCPITSSDITTPSQLLHSTRFNIEFKQPVMQNQLLEKIAENAFLKTTEKFDSNAVFELGRRYGKYGRIYAHSILLINNLLITEKSVKGWAFVPQEGNSLISTIHAFLLQTQPENAPKGLDFIKTKLLN